MPTIQANGQTLYYETHGEGEPLVCVMGRNRVPAPPDNTRAFIRCRSFPAQP